jgi:hypothetical protein
VQYLRVACQGQLVEVRKLMARISRKVECETKNEACLGRKSAEVRSTGILGRRQRDQIYSHACNSDLVLGRADVHRDDATYLVLIGAGAANCQTKGQCVILGKKPGLVRA